MGDSLYSSVADLPVTVESYQLQGLTLEAPYGERRTTVIALQGEGHEGIGEDVVWEPEEQIAFQEWDVILPLAGSFTFDAFSAHLSAMELFPNPSSHGSADFRRWAFESAALDLALRQNGCSLSDRLGRELRPVRFVLSMGLGEPPSLDRMERVLQRVPNTRFKLDPRSSWDDELCQKLAATGAVDVIDLKGAYHGTPVDQPADVQLYQRVAKAFPDAWIEDPALTNETNEALEAHRDRITWDAPIHSVEDIERLPFAPRCMNIKPSRFGTMKVLFETYEYCMAWGMALYGGGQFELGPGRGQIQYLAALFHPDGPNDVAPVEYHRLEFPDHLPESPLRPPKNAAGFRWK